jgi:hypothetical protein
LNFLSDRNIKGLSKERRAFIQLYIKLLNALGQAILTQSNAEQIKANNEPVNTSGLILAGIFERGEDLIQEEPLNELLIVQEELWLSSQKVNHLVKSELILLTHALQSDGFLLQRY